VNFKGAKSLKEQYEDVMISAYKNKESSEVVIVVVNYSDKNRTIDLSKYIVKSMYVTSKDKNLEVVKLNGENVVIEARSVSTIIGHL
jgi:hypothetical protein